MWAIRILSGSQAGQIFPLKPGQHRLGRGASCEVKIASNSVSKEHATILAMEDKILITDLNSRNGTFVNGVRVQNQKLALGDKISLHDILADIVKIPDHMANNPVIHSQNAFTPQFSSQAQQSYSAPPPAWAGNAAVQLNGQNHNDAMQAPYVAPATDESEAPASARSIGDLFYNVKIYVDNVAMPGVYALAQSMPYRGALAALVAVYIVVVTSLSIVPIVTTTKRNIQAESIRRAKTIARNMRDMNKKYVLEKNQTMVDVRSAELEEGVTAALIIDAKDGTILAPVNKRGEYVNRPFVNQARREEREFADFIDDSSLGVAVPITAYSSDTGNQAIAAYAIVLYDTGSMAMNAEQVFGLFIKTLAIALLAGGVLFFFLYKIVEHPLEAANRQLDDALREGTDDVRTDYHFTALENFISNINSALSRIGAGPAFDANAGMTMNRDAEAMNIVRMLPQPALAINAVDDRIILTNAAFDRLVGGGLNLQGQPLGAIPDNSLQQCLSDLLQRMRSTVAEIATNEIPFPDAKYEVCGQGVMGSGDPAYYLITLNREGNDG